MRSLLWARISIYTWDTKPLSLGSNRNHEEDTQDTWQKLHHVGTYVREVALAYLLSWPYTNHVGLKLYHGRTYSGYGTQLAIYAYTKLVRQTPSTRTRPIIWPPSIPTLRCTTHLFKSSVQIDIQLMATRFWAPHGAGSLVGLLVPVRILHSWIQMPKRTTEKICSRAQSRETCI